MICRGLKSGQAVTTRRHGSRRGTRTGLPSRLGLAGSRICKRLVKQTYGPHQVLADQMKRASHWFCADGPGPSLAERLFLHGFVPCYAEIQLAFTLAHRPPRVCPAPAGSGSCRGKITVKGLRGAKRRASGILGCPAELGRHLRTIGPGEGRSGLLSTSGRFGAAQRVGVGIWTSARGVEPRDAHLGRAGGSAPVS